jgi:hypothetical protein
MIASMIACTIMDASQDRLRMVSGEAKRVRIGSSISSAEDSKNEMTVLSANVSCCSRKLEYSWHTSSQKDRNLLSADGLASLR